MQDIFNYYQNKKHRKHSLDVHSRNTSSYRNSSLPVLHAQTWHSLPQNIKSSDSIYKNKDF